MSELERLRGDTHPTPARVVARATLAGLVLATSIWAGGIAWAQDDLNVLRVVPQSDLRVMDPHTTTATVTRTHGLMIYDQLFSWDESMSPQPQMVGSYTVSEDKLTYAFQLREGLKFSDGSPVTSADVVMSVERAGKQDTLLQALLTRVASFDTDGDNGFVIKLKEPFAQVEMALGSPGAVIMRVADMEAAGDAPVTTTIGSGPFRFVQSEYVPGAKIVYERNPDYVPRDEPADGMAGGKVVKVDRVEWTIMPDVMSRAAALLQDEVDLLDLVPKDAVTLIEGKPGVQLVEQSMPGWAFLRPNWLSPPFDNPKARQALAMMVNQADYMAASQGSDPQWWDECFSFFVCYGPLSPTEGSADYAKQNLEKARQLMAESGYNGETIRILSTQEIPLVGALAEVTANNLRSIGVNVSVENSDWGTLVVRRSSMEPGDWHIYHSAMDGVQTSQILMNPLINTACGGKNMAGWPCDEAVEELRQKAINDPSEANFAALNAALWTSLPVVPLGQYTQAMAARDNISGFLDTPIIVYWNIEKTTD